MQISEKECYSWIKCENLEKDEKILTQQTSNMWNKHFGKNLPTNYYYSSDQSN